MKKLIKWLLLSIALIIMLVFAMAVTMYSGAGAVVAKLREGKEFHGPRYNFSILLTR